MCIRDRIYIEQDDFMEEAPNKFYRLTLGREVRLRYGYFITCTDAIKDPVTNEIVEIRCTYDPETRGGNAPDGRKVKSTIHWVSASHAVNAEVRLYERLCIDPEPDISDGQNLESVLVSVWSNQNSDNCLHQVVCCLVFCDAGYLKTLYSTLCSRCVSDGDDFGCRVSSSLF